MRTLRLYGKNRSLRAWSVLFMYVLRRIFGHVVPPFIYLAVTYRCQCRCVHCYANAPFEDDHDNLDTEQCKSIIDQIKRLGAIGIVFTGGEPLLRDDLPHLVRHAHSLGLLTRIDTNGVLLDRKHISALKEARITQICVSIDHADPDTHDKLRDYPGAFKKAVEGIKLLGRFNIPCQIFTYVNKRNVVEGLKKIIDLARQHRVFCIQLLFPLAAGRWEDSFDEVLTDEEKKRVRELRGPPFIHFVSPGPKALCEICTKATLYISAKGDVNPCPAVPYTMGNLKKNSLDEIWRHHCEKLNLDFRGECPLNTLETREALKRYADSVAGHFSNPEQSSPEHVEDMPMEQKAR